MHPVTRSTSDWEQLLGEQLKRARIDAGLSQREVAYKANLTQKTVSNIEMGHGASLASLIKIVRVLHLEGWLESLAPVPDVDPLVVARRSVSPQRVSRR